MLKWIIIALIVIIVIIVILIYIGDSNSSQPSNNYTHYTNPLNINNYNNDNIQNCISSEDIQFQMSKDIEQIVKKVEENKQSIKALANSSKEEVDTAWLNSYKKIIRVASNLDKNLEHQRQKNLSQAKFQYYTSLHFRSMIAANIAYEEYKQIKDSYYKLKNCRNRGSQFTESLKALNDLREAYYNQVSQLNQQTAILRDKIGEECGERGRIWKKERMKNHTHK